MGPESDGAFAGFTPGLVGPSSDGGVVFTPGLVGPESGPAAGQSTATLRIMESRTSASLVKPKESRRLAIFASVASLFIKSPVIYIEIISRNNI